ncbi:Intramolecular chaperone auto-processing domain containing protein [uncultured Caudovirales phage]|uniref:Intramolecular chaperone auto-processing domain containing protein n=1 Tax=uncultured Caudovirales phage TaxID=2100421 RepID=A0A6J7WUU0_9CAUD|nr:Intramolecular chaperone auto-processing domain containing protein [uncultured Caudovirales phage]
MSTTKTPIRTVYDGSSAAVGLAEYQNGEVIGIEHGGTGGNTVAEAKLALTLTDTNIRSLISVSGGGTYDNTTGIVTINATDLTPYAKTASLTTANVTELTNLYYTVARANTAIDNRVTKAFVDALGVDATTLDGIDSLPFAKDADLTTANVTELTNLYYTNARVYSAVTGNLALKANVVDLTTANVAEVTNLYYTDARVQSNVVNYLTGNSVKTISGNLNITGNLSIAGSITTFTSNVVEIQDPMIYLGTGNSGDVNDIGIVGHFTNPGYQHTGFVRDASDGIWKLFANVATEPTNNTLDFTNATYSTIKVGDIQSATGTFTGNVSVGNISATRAIVTYADLGTVTSGTWNGSVISTTYTAAKVTSVNGQTGAATGFATTANTLSQFASTTSAELATLISDETGTGSLVFSASPTFTGTLNAAEISATGNVTSPYFYSQSDINLKKDVEPIVGALDIIKQLGGYNFKWKHNDAASIGLIAQYVEQVLPMLIGTAPDGSKTVLYNGIIALLLEAIKAQQVQIDEIKAKLNG